MRFILFISFYVSVLFLLIGCSLDSTQQGTSAQMTNKLNAAPVEVKAVVITMFEIGEDSGDEAGEFQLWKQGQKLNKRYALTHGYHDLYFNEETGVLGVLTGVGPARAAAAIMVLGLDPRFDLSHAYWLVAGIAGIDPADGSIGSAAWATWLVNGGLSHQIDAREIPTSWSTGYFPLSSHEPYANTIKTTGSKNTNGEVYQLNSDLANWAFELTKDVPLTDYPEMQKVREQYVAYPNAQKKPFVLKGDHLASATFWHGVLLNDWANDWVAFWTNGEGNFVTSGMEDTGTYQSISFLHEAGKVNKNRFMVLRTASNYTQPYKGLTAVENIKQENTGYAGMKSAVESAYTVGSKVINTITDNWSVYKYTMPYTQK